MTASTPTRPLVVCYVPGLDLRRIDDRLTPFVAALLSDFPKMPLRGQATHASAPTLFSGVGPQTHGAWGPQLRPHTRDDRSLLQRGLDRLPDWLTTTVQGFAHMTFGSIDLATMPPRRRRRFAWRRLNMKAIRDRDRTMRKMNGAPSLFGTVASSRYGYVDDFGRTHLLLERAADPRIELDVFANHALDYMQHWNMHDERLMDANYRDIDDFVRALHAKCDHRGTRLVLISDHGQEPVRRVVDPRPILTGLDVPPGSFDHFVEYAKMTLWFRDAATEARIVRRLRDVPDTISMPRADLRRYGVDFADGSFGDAVLYLRPGCSFFPNDFYQPLANAVLAAKKPGQRGRWRRPWHQGEHGYLPDHPCEDGFVVVADKRVRLRSDLPEARLIDVAPSLLAMLGMPAPAAMEGRSLLAPAAG